MTKQQRINSIMPNGKPRWIRVYDNGGPDAGENGSCDRYTVVYTGRYTHKTGGQHWYVGMNACPFHPQGIGMHGESSQPVDTIGKSGKYVWPPAIGRRCHLGKRITFDDLPNDCRRLVLNDYCELWDLPMPKNAPVASINVLSGG